MNSDSNKAATPRGNQLDFTSAVRVRLNAMLNRAGLEISTTRVKTAERTRLQRLQAAGHWKRAPYSGGLLFQPDSYMSFLQEYCGPHDSDNPRAWGESQTASGFHFENGWFDGWDAMVLYGLIRSLHPRTIIECGSGYSTRLMRQAIFDGGLETHVTSIDPQPRVDVIRQADMHVPARVEDATSIDIPSLLSANDILFIDSSHLVTSGGDVTYLCLEVLPRLQGGVLVHFHDIFLPKDYPEVVVIDEEWGWTEQYLVHAFMAYNDAFEIVWPSYYMRETRELDVTRLLGDDAPGRPSSSLWLRRVY